MTVSMTKRTVAITAASLLAGSPLLMACSGEPSGPTYSDWAATDGAAGRINLDDVQDAFKKSESATEFEKRVNEIYEGDGIILVRVKQDGETFTLEGWEDLDESNAIEDGSDDMLFSIVKKEDRHVMQGHHANGHYHSSFGAGDFLFGYMVGAMIMGGPRTTYVYQTPPAQAQTTRTQRAQYRTSPQYKSQVSRNSQYATRQQQFAGSKYQQASRQVSPARQTYQQSARSTGSFRTSNSLAGTSYKPSAVSNSGRTGGGSVSKGSNVGGGTRGGAGGGRSGGGSVGKGGGSGFSGAGGFLRIRPDDMLRTPDWLTGAEEAERC